MVSEAEQSSEPLKEGAENEVCTVSFYQSCPLLLKCRELYT